jgi:hypothetical protein
MNMKMTHQEQRTEVDKWCVELRAIMERGISKGRYGWREDGAKPLLARLQERMAQLLREPSPERAASAAAYCFMVADAMRSGADQAATVKREDLQNVVAALSHIDKHGFRPLLSFERDALSGLVVALAKGES